LRLSAASARNNRYRKLNDSSAGNAGGGASGVQASLMRGIARAARRRRPRWTRRPDQRRNKYSRSAFNCFAASSSTASASFGSPRPTSAAAAATEASIKANAIFQPILCVCASRPGPNSSLPISPARPRRRAPASGPVKRKTLPVFAERNDRWNRRRGGRLLYSKSAEAPWGDAVEREQLYTTFDGAAPTVSE